jgi:hypothetical protein
MELFTAVVAVAALTLSGYTSWITTLILIRGNNMALSPETQAQLDRIDAATSKIGEAVAVVAQRLIDLAGQVGSGTVDNTELNAALTAEADKLTKIGDDLTVLGGPSDPAVSANV